MSYIAASYSQTLRVFKRVERIHTEMIEIVDELPDQDYTDVRKIRDKVDKLDTVLTYDIRLIKSVVQNQPFSLRFRGSNDEHPAYPLIHHLDPAIYSLLAHLGTRLKRFEPRLARCPSQVDVIEGIVLDLERLLVRSVPQIRAAITRDELKTAEFQRLYRNANGVRSSNGLSLDQLQVSDDEEDVEDDVEIVAFNIHGEVDFRTRWFQEQDAESNVERPTSPPIYDSDHPLYEEDITSSDSEEEEDSDVEMD